MVVVNYESKRLRVLSSLLLVSLFAMMPMGTALSFDGQGLALTESVGAVLEADALPQASLWPVPDHLANEDVAYDFGYDGTPVFHQYDGPNYVNNAAEPTIGIPYDPDNDPSTPDPVFFHDSTSTWKATFLDEAGTDGYPKVLSEDVSSPFDIINVDPLMHGDPVTGRLHVGGLDGPCSGMSFSDDLGETWLPAANMCTFAQFDHQSLGSGPWSASVPTPPEAVSPRAYYYCAQLALTACTTSYDGGVTWGPINEILGSCGGLHGHIRVSEITGTAIVPHKGCMGFGITTNNGLTWNSRTSPGPSGASGDFDPNADFSEESGWLYFGHGGSRGAFISLSTDEGMTWETLGSSHDNQPVTFEDGTAGTAKAAKWFNVGILHDPPIRSAVFADVVAGDDERAAFAFLGSTEPGNRGQYDDCNDPKWVWHYYVATTYDAGQTWDVVRATEDPVQIGAIWSGQGGTCRNLLDFNDMKLDSEGRIYVGFADAFRGNSAANWRMAADASEDPFAPYNANGATTGQSRADWGALLRQTTGKGLYAASDCVDCSDGNGGSPELTIADADTSDPSAVVFTGTVDRQGGASTGGPAVSLSGSVEGTVGDTLMIDATVIGDSPLTCQWTADPQVALTPNEDACSGAAVQSDDPVSSTISLTASNAKGSNSATTTATWSSATQGPGDTEVVTDDVGDATTGNAYHDIVRGGASSNSDRVKFSVTLADFAGNPEEFYVKADFRNELDPPGITYSVTASSTGIGIGVYQSVSAAGISGGPRTSQDVGVEIVDDTIFFDAPRSAIGAPPDGVRLLDLSFATQTATTNSPAIHDDTGAGSYALGSTPAISVRLPGLTTPQSAPSNPPASCPVTDPVDAEAPHLDITCIWFENDDDYLYVGMAVDDIPADPTAAAQIGYSVQWSPSWGSDFGQTSGNFVGLRTFAAHDVQNFFAPTFRLEWLTTDGTTNSFGDIASLEGSADATTDIIWWIVPVTVLATESNTAPTDGDTLDSVAGETLLAVDGTLTWGIIGDGASADGYSYVWQAAQPPLHVEAGAYTGLVGAPVSLTPTISGGAGNPLCTWTSAQGTVADASACQTTITFDHPGQFSAELQVTDGGETNTDAATININDGTAAAERVELAIGGVPIGAVSVDSTGGAAQWTMAADLSGYEGQQTVEGTWFDTADNVLDTHAIIVTLSGSNDSGASVTITNPDVDGAELGAPATFTGDYATGLTVGQSQSAPLVDAPWAHRLLNDDSFKAFQRSMASLGALLTAPAADGQPGIHVYFPGAAPAVPEFFAGLPVEAFGGAEYQPMMQSFEDWVAVTPQYDGPGTPQVLGPDTIGPGTPLMQQYASGGYVCTTSFLFKDEVQGKYFLATAGHCLTRTDNTFVDTAGVGGAADYVRLCYSFCAYNWVGLGTYVELGSGYYKGTNGERITVPGYDPIYYARQSVGGTGPGNDFGIIELPPFGPGFEETLINGWMPFWGGPQDTTFASPGIGTPLVHHGHGTYYGHSTQSRAAVNLFTDDDTITYAALQSGGDSGSSIGTGTVRGDLLVGDRAAATLTHGLGIAGVGLTGYGTATTMERGLEMIENDGMSSRHFVLVTEDEATPPLSQIQPEEAIEITTPTDGATVDLSASTNVLIAGTADVPPVGGPGTAYQDLFLHRDGCGGSGAQPNTFSADEIARPGGHSGDGCGSLAGPAGLAFYLAGDDLLVQTYEGAPATYAVDNTRDLEVEIHYEAYVGPEPAAWVEIIGTLYVDGVAIASDGAAQQAATEGVLAWAIDLPDTFTGFTASSSWQFEIQIVMAAGPIYITDAGDTKIRLPLSGEVASPYEVQVSIDDASFGNPILANGAETWSAAWDASQAAPGGHTIYARILENGVMVPDGSTSIDVTVTGSNQPVPPTASYTWTSDGLAFTGTDTSDHGTSPIGDWFWDFGDGNVAHTQHATHVYSDEGVYPVTLMVMSADGTDTVTQQVRIDHNADSYLVQVKLEGLGGFDWTGVKTGAWGGAGSWSYDWSPSDAGGDYVLHARVLHDGVEVASDMRAFSAPSLNKEPVLTGPATAGGPEGEELTFEVTASDPDGDAVTITASGLPPGANFAGTTFAWTPGHEAEGEYIVNFAATDGNGGSDSLDVTITVSNTNRAPALAPIGDRAGREGAELAFTLSATDPDGDALTYAMADAPAGATLTGQAFSWTPTHEPSTDGIYTVTFSVTDGSATAEEVVDLVILDGDEDADTVANNDDQCPGEDDRLDADGDGTPDACDLQDNGDADNDGVENWEDKCPGHDDKKDLDNDLIPDGCDNDRDGDGYINDDDAFPDDPNHWSDADADGVPDGLDACPGHDDNADMDNDGRPDGCDSDRDGDGYANNRDALPDDPNEWRDSDRDGIGDNSDNCVRDANPDQADLDGDGRGDACDADRDGDGYSNNRERSRGSDPDDANSTP